MKKIVLTAILAGGTLFAEGVAFYTCDATGTTTKADHVFQPFPKEQAERYKGVEVDIYKKSIESNGDVFLYSGKEGNIKLYRSGNTVLKVDKTKIGDKNIRVVAAVDGQDYTVRFECTKKK